MSDVCAAQLKPHPLLPEYFSLKKGTPFDRCEEGTEPTVTALCELGANATDAEDGNLTSKVLACPPESCLAYGCPGHEFEVKGLQGCPLDVNATISSFFNLTFVVYDSAIPPNMAAVSRMVTIMSPCEEGMNYCELDPPVWECTKLSCDELEQLKALEDPVDLSPPVITLLGGNNLTIEYGIPAAVSLAVCPSGSAPEALVFGAQCWATALDDFDGDLTAVTTVQQLDVGGASCDHESVVTAVCEPGTYVYLYKVTDSVGNIGVATLTVYLVELATVSVVFSTRSHT